jgi:hypothetical protein
VNEDVVIAAVISASVTGIVSAVLSSLFTTAGMRVHIQYLREIVERHERNITHVHDRITKIESGD